MSHIVNNAFPQLVSKIWVSENHRNPYLVFCEDFATFFGFATYCPSMARTLSTHRLKPGMKMPGFTLPDAHGTLHSLDMAAGSPVLVAFVCNHCPYVVHLAGALSALARDHVGSLRVFAIGSNDVAAYPADAPEHMPGFAAAHGWDFPYLFDETQEVAKAYGAACTPDFFLGDANGMLFYAGQFDDTRPSKYTGVEVAPDGASMRDALRRLLAGGPPPEEVMPSMGCNIKWKPGMEPEWFPTTPV